jgi:hypothetical protein
MFSALLARHHGLPAMLLDWKSNPLVALYYAVLCDKQPTKNGALWICQRIADDLKDIDVIETRSPFDVRGVKIIYPIYVSPRLVVQCGCFTLHGNPFNSLQDDTKNNHWKLSQR